MEMDTILSWRQVTKQLSISRTTLYRLTKNGKIRCLKISEHRVGWPSSELERYINACKLNWDIDAKAP